MNSLLVDDDEYCTFLFERTVSCIRQGTTVLTCNSAKDAVQSLIESGMPRLDFVFIDQNLPGKRGTELLRRLTECPACHAAKFVMLTSALDEKTRSSALAF